MNKEEQDMQKTTLALIVGTRDFFPAEPVLEAQHEVLDLLAEMGTESFKADLQKEEFEVPCRP